MLANLKTDYFLKNIFSFINEEIKLKLIIYNKKIQNILDINIINYKFYSGKYIITENDGNVKIYNYKHDLLYEGGYNNRKKNGKGKEYRDLSLYFEGEFLNGKKWNGYGFCDGIKTFYLKNGKGYIKDYKIIYGLQFEGEYINGERNGKGKEFNGKNKILFEGEYLNGKRRRGREYSYDGQKLIFEGEYFNGKRWNGKLYNKQDNKIYEIKNGHGFVKEIDEYNYSAFEGEYMYGEKWNGKILKGNNIIYEMKERKIYKKEYLFYNCYVEGEYINNKLNGKGIVIENQLKFEGEYLYDFKKKGKEYINGILEYEGEYLYNKKWNGKGYDMNGNVIYELKNGNGNVKEYYSGDDLIYEGEYLNGRRHGKGKYYYPNNILMFEGEFRNGKNWDGTGKEYNTETGMWFEGEYKNGKRNGKGKEYNGDNQVLFEGEYKDNERNGQGKEFTPDGSLIFEGEYLNGKRNGTGKEYDINGELVFEGEYFNGERKGIIEYYNNENNLNLENNN